MRKIKPELSTLHPQTQVVHTEMPRTVHREQSSVLYLNSGHRFNSYEQGRQLFAGEEEGLVYARWDNPNNQEFIQKLCSMEQCEDGVATASGMAAIHITMDALLQAGDHILSTQSLFGTTQRLVTEFLPRKNISYSQLPITSTAEQWKKAIRPETRMIFIESPSNPGLELADIAMIAAVADQSQVLFVVDNCLATPVLQQPAVLGADIVIHSATKFIDGQGRCMGGAILASSELIKKLRAHIRTTGAVLSSFNAWLLARGMDTLPLRIERQSANALALAEYLAARQDIARIHYPFLPSHPQYSLAKTQMRAGSALICFDLPGGEAQARSMLAQDTFLMKLANFGDIRSIITHPASTTHASLSEEERKTMNINSATIRVSVGIEHIDDIIAEFERLLA